MLHGCYNAKHTCGCMGGGVERGKWTEKLEQLMKCNSVTWKDFFVVWRLFSFKSSEVDLLWTKLVTANVNELKLQHFKYSPYRDRIPHLSQSHGWSAVAGKSSLLVIQTHSYCFWENLCIPPARKWKISIIFSIIFRPNQNSNILSVTCRPCTEAR